MGQKRNVIEGYEQSIIWVKSLEGLTEERWRMPIAPGKWTIAEVIGHLVPWDEFVLARRLPYFFDGKPLPPGPDAEQMNGRASEKAKKRSKEVTIALFAGTRDKLLRALKDIPEANWSREVCMSGKPITLTEYMNGLLTHDRSHFAQIHHALEQEAF